MQELEIDYGANQRPPNLCSGQSSHELKFLWNFDYPSWIKISHAQKIIKIFLHLPNWDCPNMEIWCQCGGPSGKKTPSILGFQKNCLGGFVLHITCILAESDKGLEITILVNFILRVPLLKRQKNVQQKSQKNRKNTVLKYFVWVIFQPIFL